MIQIVFDTTHAQVRSSWLYFLVMQRSCIGKYISNTFLGCPSAAQPHRTIIFVVVVMVIYSKTHLCNFKQSDLSLGNLLAVLRQLLPYYNRCCQYWLLPQHSYYCPKIANTLLLLSVSQRKVLLSFRQCQSYSYCCPSIAATAQLPQKSCLQAVI